MCQGIIQQQMDDLLKEDFFRLPAKRIKENLEPLLSKSDKLKKRWVWELIQNATDLGDDIKVKFVIDDDQLTFSHNGRNFSRKEAKNLVIPDSTKDENDAEVMTIGRFGTGFLTTHILSTLIKINGYIEDVSNDVINQFTIILDRTDRDDRQKLADSIKKSWEEFINSIHPTTLEVMSRDHNGFNTSFTFYINKSFPSLNGNEIANAGIESLESLIPYVLSFRPQLKEVELDDKRSGHATKKIFRKKDVKNFDENLSINEIQVINNRYDQKQFVGVIRETSSDGNLQAEIAFPVEIKEEVYEFLPLGKEIPRLFCAFPLIGANDFKLPVVLNSLHFIPNREREGIELSEYDEINRNILLLAVKAYKKLLSIAESEKWREVYNICNLDIPNINDEKVRLWYREHIFKDLKNSVISQRLVVVKPYGSDRYVKEALQNISVPYTDKKPNNDDLLYRLYDVAYKIMVGKVPAKDEFKKWYQTLNFEIFSEIKLDVEKLCDKLQTIGLPNLSRELSLSDEDIVKIIGDLVKVIIDLEKTEVLNKYNILPDQRYNLKTLNKLKVDHVTDDNLTQDFKEKIKDIQEYLSTTIRIIHPNQQLMLCRDFLLHNQLTDIVKSLDSTLYTLEDLSKDIDSSLRYLKYNTNINVLRNNRNYLQVLKDLFNWYNNCGIQQSTLKDLFPYFTDNKAMLFLETKDSEDLEHVFEIEISGKIRALSALAKTNLTTEEITIIINNSEFFKKMIHSIQELIPELDEEMIRNGEIGEAIIFDYLVNRFGNDRVIKKDNPAYDFEVLTEDLSKVQYYIEAKSTSTLITQSDNIPFYVRSAQWNFMEQPITNDKYILARIFLNDPGNALIKFLKIDLIML